MRILVISDMVDRRLYSDKIEEITGPVDLIISCGDLPAYYLDFIASSLNKPLLYVCGNHDHYEPEKMRRNNSTKRIPVFNQNIFSHMYVKKSGVRFGGKNIDNTVEKYKGLLITGLEGSLIYNYGEHQYSEGQMRRKIAGLFFGLLVNRIFKGRYLDILVTHAPPYGIHDAKDPAHVGFKSYLSFIRFFHPKYLLHGHIHIYDSREKRVTEYMGTKIINCYDFQIIDV